MTLWTWSHPWFWLMEILLINKVCYAMYWQKRHLIINWKQNKFTISLKTKKVCIVFYCFAVGCFVILHNSSSVRPCHTSYSIFDEDTANHTTEWQDLPLEKLPHDDRWTYFSDAVTKAVPIVGTFALYGGGGFMIDLGKFMLKTIKRLHESLQWFLGSFSAITRRPDALKVNYDIMKFVCLSPFFKETRINLALGYLWHRLP